MNMDNKLRAFRKRNKLSVPEVARTLKMTTQNVYMIENGRHQLRLEHVKKLAKVFRVPVTELI